MARAKSTRAPRNRGAIGTDESASGTVPEFSVIITCYYEEKSIREFHARLSSSLKKLGRHFEIVLVNDGSTDGTFAEIGRIFDEDPTVSTAIDLFRNAGQIAAMSAGIVHARGRHFVFMDSDLQLEPEELGLLLKEFDAGFDIVSGFRTNRQDGVSRKLASWAANRIMRKVSGHTLSDFGCTFKVYRGELVRAFGFGPDKAWKTAYVFAQAGRVKEVPITHHRRKYGKSGWTFSKLSAFLMDHVVGMSRRPFQYVALTCLGLAAILMLRIASAWVLPITILPEVTAGLLLNVMLFNVLVTIGVISVVGEYVVRNFVSVQHDPIYVIRELRRKPESESGVEA